MRVQTARSHTFSPRPNYRCNHRQLSTRAVLRHREKFAGKLTSGYRDRIFHTESRGLFSQRIHERDTNTSIPGAKFYLSRALAAEIRAHRGESDRDSPIAGNAHFASSRALLIARRRSRIVDNLTTTTTITDYLLFFASVARVTLLSTHRGVTSTFSLSSSLSERKTHERHLSLQDISGRRYRYRYRDESR